MLIGVRLWSRKRNAKSGWNDATVAIPESHRTWVGGSFGGKQEIASVGRRHLSRRAVVILKSAESSRWRQEIAIRQ